MSVHENLEHAEHAEHAAHEGGNNRKIALIIAVLALFLAFSETFGKSAQTTALNNQIEASDLWNFYQAKSIRRTTILTAAATAKIELAATTDEAKKDAITKQIAEWEKTAARYSSDPQAGGGKGEGTVELAKRAQAMEKARDRQLNGYHNFELGSAAFQIGIVLCSAAVITGMVWLAWAAILVGLIGLVFTAGGLFMPEALHNAMHAVEALFAGGGGEHH
jgi:hypothetical protein